MEELEVRIIELEPMTVASAHGFGESPELIANEKTPEEICETIGADTLGYLSLEGLRKSAEPLKIGTCDACFSREYPVSVESIEVMPQLSLFRDVSEDDD